MKIFILLGLIFVKSVASTVVWWNTDGFREHRSEIQIAPKEEIQRLVDLNADVLMLGEFPEDVYQSLRLEGFFDKYHHTFEVYSDFQSDVGVLVISTHPFSYRVSNLSWVNEKDEANYRWWWEKDEDTYTRKYIELTFKDRSNMPVISIADLVMPWMDIAAWRTSADVPREITFGRSNPNFIQAKSLFKNVKANKEQGKKYLVLGDFNFPPSFFGIETVAFEMYRKEFPFLGPGKVTYHASTFDYQLDMAFGNLSDASVEVIDGMESSLHDPIVVRY